MTSPYLTTPFRTEAQARNDAGRRRPTAVEMQREMEISPRDRDWLTRAAVIGLAAASLACWALVGVAMWWIAP